eukprot:Amastigsp_a843774_204.p2 type:complete len:125 gc:universal Amastigsp_a843774_204:418-792(+)
MSPVVPRSSLSKASARARNGSSRTSPRTRSRRWWISMLRKASSARTPSLSLTFCLRKRTFSSTRCSTMSLGSLSRTSMAHRSSKASRCSLRLLSSAPCRCWRSLLRAACKARASRRAIRSSPRA